MKAPFDFYSGYELTGPAGIFLVSRLVSRVVRVDIRVTVYLLLRYGIQNNISGVITKLRAGKPGQGRGAW